MRRRAARRPPCASPATAAALAAASAAAAATAGGGNSGGGGGGVEGESAERRALREKREAAVAARVSDALRDKLERDQAAAEEEGERAEVAESFGPKHAEWAKKGRANIRQLLASLHEVLWPEAAWKGVGLMEVVSPQQVRKVWMRVLFTLHPDKVQQRGCTPSQRFIADKVFHTLLEAYNAFAAKEL